MCTNALYRQVGKDKLKFFASYSCSRLENQEDINS